MTTETTKRSNSPLYPSQVSITIQDIQSHRRLHNYIVQYWRKNMSYLSFPDQVNMILRFVPSLCFVPCFFLSYTCCRVGELKQIKMSYIKNREPFQIKSSKSDHLKTITPLNVFKPKLLRSISLKTKIVVVSYDHLKNSIRQAKKRANIKTYDNILDLTHIFRHLTATDLFEKGVDLSVISEKLGHINPESTKLYIH